MYYQQSKTLVVRENNCPQKCSALLGAIFRALNRLKSSWRSPDKVTSANSPRASRGQKGRDCSNTPIHFCSSNPYFFFTSIYPFKITISILFDFGFPFMALSFLLSFVYFGCIGKTITISTKKVLTIVDHYLTRLAMNRS